MMIRIVLFITYLPQTKYLKPQKSAVSSLKQCEYERNLVDNAYWIFYWDSANN